MSPRARTTYRVFRFHATRVSVQTISAAGRHLSMREFYDARRAAEWLCAPERDGLIHYVPRTSGVRTMTTRGEQTMPATYGYDGIALEVGDRVEIHPATDLWMRGARYGTIVRMSLTPIDRVRVSMDKLRRDVSGSADTFRRV